MEIMVMREEPQPRATYLLTRGAYDAPGRQVQGEVPVSLPPWPSGAPRNRLGLAQWLTSPDHPLCARVAVNRFWHSVMGQGLVRSVEDLGSQGSAPTHPELLDWLARHLIESSWDVKQLVKLIAMSATYRQDSACTAELRARDPANELLARSASGRLSAEMVRDNALWISGLLVEKRGGPPVKPYQPAGLWKEKSGQVYTRDEGEGSHRRSLYTYWKRTSPPPSMMIFDAAKRDVCVARRQPTATPLQALVQWNDPQFVEAARGLAQRTMRELPEDPDAQINRIFHRATQRLPRERELAVLRSLYADQLELYQQSEKDAVALLSIGDEPRDESLQADTLAALTMVAQAILGFDETLMRR